MKLLLLLTMASLFVSCASQDRKIAAQEEESLSQTERIGEFGAGYRH